MIGIDAAPPQRNGKNNSLDLSNPAMRSG